MKCPFCGGEMEEGRLIDLDFFPDAADVYGNGIFRGKTGFIPDPLIDFVNGEHPVLVFHQKLQDPEFNRGQLDIFTVYRQGFVHRVQDKSACLEHVFLLGHIPQGHIPPQGGADPGNQLQGVERLCDIIVGTHIESQNLVGILAFGRDEDDGDVAILADLHHGANAIQAGHHDIQQDQVDGVV